MKIEINSRQISDTGILAGGAVMITPPISEDYWLMRVPLSDKQAIICFPKFGMIGIGFQHEEDWNTNLRSSRSAEDIYEHIKHNKGDKSIKDSDCIDAIRMLQKAIEEV